MRCKQRRKSHLCSSYKHRTRWQLQAIHIVMAVRHRAAVDRETVTWHQFATTHVFHCLSGYTTKTHGDSDLS